MLRTLTDLPRPVARGEGIGESRSPLLLRASHRSVALGREDKVALGQAADLVRPNVDDEAAPRNVEIRVMLLLFGQGADACGCFHRAREIVKPVRAGEQLQGTALGIGPLHYTPARA